MNPGSKVKLKEVIKTKGFQDFLQKNRLTYFEHDNSLHLVNRNLLLRFSPAAAIQEGLNFEGSFLSFPQKLKGKYFLPEHPTNSNLAWDECILQVLSDIQQYFPTLFLEGPSPEITKDFIPLSADEEKLWTKVLDHYGYDNLFKPYVPKNNPWNDLVKRLLGNREE